MEERKASRADLSCMPEATLSLYSEDQDKGGIIMIRKRGKN